MIKYLLNRPLMIIGIFILVTGNIVCYNVNGRLLSIVSWFPIVLVIALGINATIDSVPEYNKKKDEQQQ